jgi:hypothetical protein
MLHHVALVKIDVTKELSASVIRVTRIGELGTTLAVTSNRRTLWRNTANVPSSLILVPLIMEALSSSETSVLTRATWRNIPEDAILQALHSLETVWTERAFRNVCRVVRWKSVKLALLLDSFFAYSLMLKMVAVHSLRLFLDFYRTLHCHIPEDHTLHCKCCEDRRPALIQHTLMYSC